MEHVTPSGHKVVFKDPTTFSHGDRKRIMAGRAENNPYAGMDAMLSAVITDWDYDLVIPSIKPETLDALSPADYDSLVAGTEPFMDILFPKLSEPAPGEVVDPKAPTNS